jgi:linoleoyl-CoA desaturase
MQTDSPQVRFRAGGAFHSDLMQRAHDYFEASARSRHGGWAIALKVAAMLSWLVGSYALLMFAHPTAWQAVLLSVSIGLAMAGVGFCVMHDANHGAASSSARVNRMLSFSLDLLGASSVLWRHKHNVMHHTYTNISGSDPDLEGGGPFLRLAPWQRRRAWHRFQHLYVWLLYGLFPLKWWFVDDVRDLIRNGVGKRALFGALAGKALFIGWAFALPAIVHPSWALLALWGIAIFTLGNVLAAVFQLAHCVGDADFVEPPHVERGWAHHQVATTVDFAPANPLLSWYLGGLNFQVEHHLFSRVCHVHYRALARIVRETCLLHRVRYRCRPTLRSALGANFRWLRRMGLPAPA